MDNDNGRRQVPHDAEMCALCRMQRDEWNERFERYRHDRRETRFIIACGLMIAVCLIAAAVAAMVIW